MKYDTDKKEIILDKELNELDKYVLEFIKILEKHVDYVIISGYVSILLGRSRSTEDIDLFIKRLDKNKFSDLYKDLIKNKYWCLNAEDSEEIYDYLINNFAVRFAKKDETIPNFEVKFPKNRLDEDAFEDHITVILPMGRLKISSLERQIAFKRYYLKSNKDLEDAKHVEHIFKDKIDIEKIYKYKRVLEPYEKTNP